MPGVDRDPNCQTYVLQDGQDGYALVDKARYEALEAECERLRKALRDIEHVSNVHDPGHPIGWVWEIARKALGDRT